MRFQPRANRAKRRNLVITALAYADSTNTGKIRTTTTKIRRTILSKKGRSPKEKISLNT